MSFTSKFGIQASKFANVVFAYAGDIVNAVGVFRIGAKKGGMGGSHSLHNGE